MTKILFVCHGNICRSPMAEFILKDMVKKEGCADRFEIASAAVSTEEIGNPVYPPAKRELARHGISCAGKTARQITMHDVRTYDRIYYMDSSNLRFLRRMFPNDSLFGNGEGAKFFPLLPRDVADPWYTGDFETTYRDIEQGCRAIMQTM